MRSVFEWGGAFAAAIATLSLASLAALAALPPGDPTGEPAVDVAVDRAAPVSGQRAQALRHLLIQDCGSCHGLTLAGGLGPPLQSERLANLPVEFLAYTILNGRPGTAMPPWSAFLTESEGLWLARELKGLNR
jgi:cytochrome c55X